MIAFGNFIGLLLVILCAGLVLLFSAGQRRRAAPPLRPLPAFQRLRQAIGLAVEEGKRLHVSLGSASLAGPSSPSALAGLAALRRLAQVSIISDRPPVATSGDSGISLLSQDVLRGVYKAANASEQYHPDSGRLTGISAFTYAAGAMPVIRKEQVAANLFIGRFGPEILLLNDAASEKDSFVLAASDSLPGQAVLYAAAKEPLIGEELYAVPAYLQASPAHHASLRAQDVLRWLLIGLVIGGAVVRLASSILGMGAQ